MAYGIKCEQKITLYNIRIAGDNVKRNSIKVVINSFSILKPAAGINTPDRQFFSKY
jgi:hypothetical protein